MDEDNKENFRMETVKKKGMVFAAIQQRRVEVYLPPMFRTWAVKTVKACIASSFLEVDILQWRIQNPVKHLKWSILRK